MPIVRQRGSLVDITMGEKEYVAVRISRYRGTKEDKCCNVFQDASGDLVIEYKNKRVIDEREDVIQID